MDLDLRVPIGLFFVLVGLIMTIFGLTSNPAIYDKSLGINVNLDWGLVELIFGALMIVFGRPRHKAEPVAESAAGPSASRLDLPPPQPSPKPPIQHV
jgi:hypothetical protein